VIVDDFCLLCAHLCNKVIYVCNFESHARFAGRCLPWEVTSGAENLVLPRNPGGGGVAGISHVNLMRALWRAHLMLVFVVQRQVAVNINYCERK
jgi:hypothetical protein